MLYPYLIHKLSRRQLLIAESMEQPCDLFGDLFGRAVYGHIVLFAIPDRLSALPRNQEAYS